MAPEEVDYTDYTLHPTVKFQQIWHHDRCREGHGGQKVQRNSYYSAQIDSKCCSQVGEHLIGHPIKMQMISEEGEQQGPNLG